MVFGAFGAPTPNTRAQVECGEFGFTDDLLEMMAYGRSLVAVRYRRAFQYVGPDALNSTIALSSLLPAVLQVTAVRSTFPI